MKDQLYAEELGYVLTFLCHVEDFGDEGAFNLRLSRGGICRSWRGVADRSVGELLIRLDERRGLAGQRLAGAVVPTRLGQRSLLCTPK